MASLKKNFLFNVSITIGNYITGLIVFPYVTRCLGVELIGKTGFAQNVVAYFSLFALLGAVTVGTREIAACRDSIKERSIVFSSILTFIIILTGLSLFVMTLSTFLVPKFEEYRTLLLIGSFTLVFTSLQIEWLYQGVENFSYIAIRSLLIKTLYCISVFIFIHDKDDYVIYYILTTSIVIVNGLVNMFYAKKFVTFSFHNIELKKYAKPFLSYGLNKVLISMYTTFNVLYLGLVCTNTEVGYYTTSNKLFQILLGVISAFTYVILPRMSSLLADNNKEEFNNKIEQSFQLILSIAIPISIGGVILAPQIIRLLAGNGYEGANVPMMIIMPVIILTGLAQICIMQVLIPMKKDKVVLVASFVGAIVGISANIIFVGKLGAIGSAMVLFLSELFSDIFCFGYAIKNKILVFPWKELGYQILGGIPYMILCYLSINIIGNYIGQLFLSIGLCGIYFFALYMFIRKETMIRHIIYSTLNLKN